MTSKVVQINGVGNVIFFRNPRSRRIRLSVAPGPRTRVSYPMAVPLAEAVRFAESQSGWILQQQQKFRNSQPSFREETEIATRYHRVIIRRGGPKTTVKQIGFHIAISTPGDQEVGDSAVQEQISRIMTEIYRWEARKYLPGRLKELAALHRFQVNRVTIRDNRTNWGSCSGKNNISLNLHLMKLPDHLIDFILLHELAHTRVRNHGPEFWKLLDSLTGNRARSLSAEIRKHSVRSG